MKKYICTILSVILILVNITPTIAGTVWQKSEAEKYLDEISRYEMKAVTKPSYGSSGGEWLIMGLARYGTISDEYILVYKNNLKKHLDSCNGILSKNKYTEYARTVLALTAIGENPENFEGYNLLKPLAEFDRIVSMGANEIIYTLIALDSKSYEIPEPKEDYAGKKTTRERLVNAILDNQKENGGWCLAGTKSDADVTAMAIQALAPYCRGEKKVENAVLRGIDRLSELQLSDGGYKSIGRENCESNAQVLTALSVMSISMNDKRFVKNGYTVIDGLMKYYKSSGFSHFPNGDINQIATEQALYGLTAYYRNISGMNGLFEMSDGITKRVLKNTDESEDVTVKNSGKPKTQSNNKGKPDKGNKASSKNNDKKTKQELNIEKNTIEITSKTQVSEKHTAGLKREQFAEKGIEESGQVTNIQESFQTESKEINEKQSGSYLLQKRSDRRPITAAVVLAVAIITGAVVFQKVKKQGKKI